MILQDTKSLPENSSVSVDTGNNLDNAFYTDKMLPVVTDGSIISKTQSLDDIPKRRAETLIDIEDEWFLSLQQVQVPPTPPVASDQCWRIFLLSALHTVRPSGPC